MTPFKNSYSHNESSDAQETGRNGIVRMEPNFRHFRLVRDALPFMDPHPPQRYEPLRIDYGLIRQIYQIRLMARRVQPEILLFRFIRAPFGSLGGGSSRSLLRRQRMSLVPFFNLYKIWSVTLVVVRDRLTDWEEDVTRISGLIIRRSSDRSPRTRVWFDSGATVLSFIVVWN